MAKGSGAQRRRSSVTLAEAALCADEHYYQALAQPLMRQGITRRLRNLVAQLGLLGAAVCALVVIAALVTATPAPALHASFLAELRARFVAVAPAVADALVVALLLGVTLAVASVWARQERAEERRIETALLAKTRLARNYRKYLTELVKLTEPLRWIRPAMATAAADGEPLHAVLVSLTLRHESQWDDAQYALMSDEGLTSTLNTFPAFPSAAAPMQPLTRYSQGVGVGVAALGNGLDSAVTVTSVSRALASAPSNAIILGGGEGAGKTTLMRNLVHALALAQLQSTQPNGRIPFYADLAWLEEEWPGDGAAAVAGGLASLVARIGGLEPEDARDLAHALVSEPSLLLLDELDTLPSEQRERLTASISAFLTEGRRLIAPAQSSREGGAWSAQVVLGARSTSASLGYGPLRSRFQRWQLEPLAYPLGRLALVRGVLGQQRASAEPTEPTEAVVAQGDGAAERLLVALDMPQTERWLTQPLALTLAALASVGAPSVTAPRTQSALYHAAVRALLRIHLPDWTPRERAALTRVAEELALWLQRAGRRVFRPGDPRVDEWLAQFPETATVMSRSDVASPSVALAALSGLCEVGPGGLACFNFVTLHGFFAGRALAHRMLHEDAAGDASDARALRVARGGGVIADGRSVEARASAAPTDGEQSIALALAWTHRASASWRDTLRFMCGALGDVASMEGGRDSDDDERQEERGSVLAARWLRALLEQSDMQASVDESPHAGPESLEALESLGVELAATSLPELRGEPADATLAVDTAMHMFHALGKNVPPSSQAVLVRRYQACATMIAHPVARQALLDLLVMRLLGDNARLAQQAAQTLCAIGRDGAQFTPMLVDLLRSTNGVQRAAVAQAIGGLGPTAGAQAQAALFDALTDPSPIARAALVEALGEVVTEPDDALIAAVIACLADRSGDVRAAAALALGKMNASTDEVADALRRALSDRRAPVQIAAAHALGMVDRQGRQVPALIVALERSWRDRVALALGALGEVAAPALPKLLELAHADVAIQRESAIRALVQIAPRRADVLTTLIERLRDPAPECRSAAAEGLAQIARTGAISTDTARRVYPELLSMLQDNREPVRVAAVEALDALGATDDPMTRAGLYALLDDRRAYVRAAATQALETLAGPDARQLPAHIARLSVMYDDMRLVAIGELGALGADALVALPALVAVIRDPAWDIRRAALQAMRQIAPEYDTTITQSIVCANDSEPLVRLAALTALGAHAPKHDRLTLEALRRRLHSDSEDAVRAEAARALGRMGPRAAAALPLLLRALNDQASETRRAAALAIGALQPDLATVTAGLIEMLIEAESGARGAVALAMGALGSRAAPTLVAELLALLKDQSALVRAAAAEALGKVGPAIGASAAQALLQRLDDADGDLRAAAAQSLGQIGVSGLEGVCDATELENALLTRLYDRRAVVRRSAVMALTNLGPATVARSLQPLLEMLTDMNLSLRDAILAALTTLDATERAAILPTVVAWLGADTASQRAAALALAAIHPSLEPAATDALRLLLTSADHLTRAAAAHAVGALSATTFSAGPPSELSQLLGDSAWQARAAAAAALGQFGAYVSVEDQRTLRATLADAEESVRQAATRALAQIDRAGVKALVAELLAMLKSRQSAGPLAGVAQRAEADIYAALTWPTWAIVERVSGWLMADAFWPTQLNAITLFGRWRYAPMAARLRLLELRARAPYAGVRRAAHVALQAILTEEADLDPSAFDGAVTWASLTEQAAHRRAGRAAVSEIYALPIANASDTLGADAETTISLVAERDPEETVELDPGATAPIDLEDTVELDPGATLPLETENTVVLTESAPSVSAPANPASVASPLATTKPLPAKVAAEPPAETFAETLLPEIPVVPVLERLLERQPSAGSASSAVADTTILTDDAPSDVLIPALDAESDDLAVEAPDSSRVRPADVGDSIGQPPRIIS